MITAKIICILLGFAFLCFGFFIYFKKRFDLINGFTEDYSQGRKDEKYALKVGIIEFVIGLILLIVGIILCLFF